MKSREDVEKLMVQVFADCMKTREDGQKEYAHYEENALSNFERQAAELDLPREKVWYIFAKKHWDGVLAWIKGHRSQREDVRGRIKDLIVYLVLFWAMVDDTTLVFEDELASTELRFDDINKAIEYIESQGYEVRDK